MDNVERLMEFGLTRHEASLYVLLVLEGSLNGYEAAKQSGISRSNAYSALAGLVEKGSGLYAGRRYDKIYSGSCGKSFAAARSVIWKRRRKS